MNKFKGILVLTVLAFVSAGAWAKDDGVKVARDQANATYEMDKKGCQPLGKDEKKDCMRRASAEHAQQIEEVRDMEKAQAKERKSARKEKRDEKRRLKAHSGGDRSYEESESSQMQLPSPGAQSDLSKPTAKHTPGMYMGKAPVTAMGPVH